jgi:hypothetical protein
MLNVLKNTIGDWGLGILNMFFIHIKYRQVFIMGP